MIKILKKIRQELLRNLRRLYSRYEAEIKNDILLENVFKKNYPKKVLLSYITSPFVKGIDKKHSASLECYTAAQIFDQLGFCVDVVSYMTQRKNIADKKYDVVYGFGNILLAEKAKGSVSIVYGTGCSGQFANHATLLAGQRFFKNRGILALSSLRIPTIGDTSLYFSDLIIPLGNQFVANTYRIKGGCRNIQSLSAFYFDCYDIDLTKKDISSTRRNFVWFGSSGAIHKGLDIILDIFKKRSDLNLFICGFKKKHEPEFYNFYKKELDNKVDNIKNLGFLDLTSSDFFKLMDQCCACIFPSVSEGGSPAVLNIMANGGLIPIISESTGIDVDPFGFVFKNCSNDDVLESIEQFLKLSNSEILERMFLTKETIRKKHSHEYYQENLKKIISSIIK